MSIAPHVWRRIFLVKGVYNVAVSLVMLLWTTKLLPLLGEPAGNLAFPLLFLWVALGCGVGYLIVGCDVERNHGVVVVGIIGQAGVFGVLASYWLKGSVYATGLIFGCVDLAFAVAFVIFLWTYAYRTPSEKLVRLE
jgi:nitrate/nitrite transporter NarK